MTSLFSLGSCSLCHVQYSLILLSDHSCSSGPQTRNRNTVSPSGIGGAFFMVSEKRWERGKERKKERKKAELEETYRNQKRKTPSNVFEQISGVMGCVFIM